VTRGATIIASGPSQQQQALCPEEKHRHEASIGLYNTSRRRRYSVRPANPAESSAITYSSPRVNGRAGHIFTKDGLISHDETYPIWRAGANAATILHTDADLDVGKPAIRLPKGSYSLYVDISDPDHWVLIINKQTGQWGTNYDPAQDLVRAKMDMDVPPATVENLKYTLKRFGGGSNIAELTLSWENHDASVLLLVK
jgi:hypothetical protein